MMKLTTDEIARGLGIPIQTLERWIRQGRIPLQRKGMHCEFQPADLEAWAEKHQLQLRLSDPASKRKNDPDETKLWEAVRRGEILYGVEGRNRQEVLHHLIQGSRVVPESRKESLQEMLMQRERLASTGVGKGVAVPHPRSPMQGVFREAVIITGFPEVPVDYESIDGRPVFAMFVLLSPQIRTHLHLLSRLSYCIRNDAFIEFLKTAPQPEPLIQKILDIEQSLDAGEKS